MARDSNIYGTDTNEFASGIARDALNPGGAKEDVWGSTFDQSAKSEGDTPDSGEVKAAEPRKPDSRAKSEGN